MPHERQPHPVTAFSPARFGGRGTRPPRATPAPVATLLDLSLLEPIAPAPWSHALPAAGGGAGALLPLRRRRDRPSAEEPLVHRAVLINTKGQLLQELALDDEADLGYAEVMQLLAGKGILKVETVRADPFHGHFLHWDDPHLACVSSSPSRTAVAQDAEDLRDRLLTRAPCPA